jgi:ABC-type glycerol-3-phosphate transport system substrate-binding protein
MILSTIEPVLAVQDHVLEVWTHEFPPLQNGMTKKWIPEFEAKNPGVKIKMTAIPFAGVISFDAKLLAALSGGEGPDLWDMGDWNYKTFIDNKFLAPFDPKIFGYASDQEMSGAYLPGTMDIFVRDGKVYGLFSEYNTLALFYNLDMFEKAGIPLLPADKPASWKQIEEISAKLRKTDQSGALTQIGYQFGFFASFRSPQWYAQNFYAFMRQYGQDDLYVDGKPAANTEPVKKAFQTLYDFTHTSKAYDPTFLNNWFADFPKGRVAMVLAGTWFVPAIKQNNPNVRFGVAPHPVTNPDDKTTYKNIQWSWGWSVNANKPPERQRLAQEFLAFILGKKGETEQAAWWFSTLGYTQPGKAFLESKAYADKLAADPWLKQWVDAFKLYKIGYVPHSYDEPGAALMRAMDRVVYDKMSPEESAKLLQAELQRLQ